MTTESTEEKTEPILNKSTALLIDETTVFTFHPKPGRKTLQGEDLTDPEFVISFVADFDRFNGKLDRIGRLYRKTGAVRLWLEFTEQLDHGLARKVPKVGEEINPRPRLTDPLGTLPKNGQRATHVDDLANDDTPPEHIGKAAEKVHERAKKRAKT
jgi:hypothetical protein